MYVLMHGYRVIIHELILKNECDLSTFSVSSMYSFIAPFTKNILMKQSYKGKLT